MTTVVERSVAELILVGDSLGGIVFPGHDSTIPVNLEGILYHVLAVRRGCP